jgi:hypothetical protein
MSPIRAVLSAVAVAGSLVLGASVAAAEEPLAVQGHLGHIRATEADGFDGLPWGADLKAVYARWPELKKSYPPAKVGAILKKGGGAILETRLSFKGVTYPGKLYIDGKGLYRVTLELKFDDDGGMAGASIDKLLDPVLGDLSTPDEETAETRLWKGSATVVAVTRTRGVGSSRLDIGFHAKAAYRPENAGGSLGIE